MHSTANTCLLHTTIYFLAASTKLPIKSRRRLSCTSARQGYNDLVQKFNEYKKSFPNVILAGVFGFSADAQNLEFSENLEQPDKVLPN
jgi:hypothetical protein